MKALKFKTLLLVSVLIVGVTSCSKYEEGGLSLRTKKARVVGDWYVYQFIESDGNIETFTNNGYNDFTFEKDGTALYSSTYSIGNGQNITEKDTFSWEFVSNKEKLKWTYSDGDSEMYEILKLQHDEMWLRLEENNYSIDIHLNAR